MRYDIPLRLSRFGWTILDERASAEGFEVAAITEQACGYYASEVDSGRMAVELPTSGRQYEGDAVRLLTLELGHHTVEVLEREVRRQGVSLESLVRHATLLYLADLDAGRVADRVAQRVAGPGRTRSAS
jgi:hypothetical protein